MPRGVDRRNDPRNDLTREGIRARLVSQTEVTRDAVAGERISDYNPERDDFDDYTDTPDDYEGDKYTRHEFEGRSDTPGVCRNCQEDRSWHNHG